MKHCLSVRSDLDTEEGRLLFANDIVERLFTRVWKDDKIMRRKRYFESKPEAQRKYIPAAPHDSRMPGCGPRHEGGRLGRPKMATPDLGDSGLVPLFELVLVRG